MFNKKTLGVAVAAATVSMGANALVDMDSATPTVSTYAAETLSAADTQTGADTNTYYNVNDGGTNLDIQSVLGVGVSNGNQLFLRFDFDGGVIGAGAAANSDLAVNGNNNNITVAQGGNAGDAFVIYSLTAPTDLTAGDLVNLSGIDELGISASGNVGVTYTAYETLTGAVNQGPGLYDNEVQDYVSTAPGAAATFTPTNQTADVTTNFLNFLSPPANTATNASLGSLVYAAVPGIVAANDGLAVTIGDVADTAASIVNFNGDFSFGAWELNGLANCTAGGAFDLTPSIGMGDGTTASATLADVIATSFLCVTVDGTDDIIPTAQYAASGIVSPANGVNNVNAPTAILGNLGEIERNGTTIQAPYITTFEGYNQRIILVNRGTTEALYTSMFTPEDGTTATPGPAATGVLQPGETLIIPARDFVTLEGRTRTAATITISAPAGNIDAATTQVNLSDGGTDTVVLN